MSQDNQPSQTSVHPGAGSRLGATKSPREAEFSFATGEEFTVQQTAKEFEGMMPYFGSEGKEYFAKLGEVLTYQQIGLIAQAGGMLQAMGTRDIEQGSSELGRVLRDLMTSLEVSYQNHTDEQTRREIDQFGEFLACAIFNCATFGLSIDGFALVDPNQRQWQAKTPPSR